MPPIQCTAWSVPWLAIRRSNLSVYACLLQAEAARDLLEIQADRLQVEQGEVGYIIGKGGETIRELQVSPMYIYIYIYIYAHACMRVKMHACTLDV